MPLFTLEIHPQPALRTTFKRGPSCEAGILVGPCRVVDGPYRLLPSPLRITQTPTSLFPAHAPFFSTKIGVSTFG